MTMLERQHNHSAFSEPGQFASTPGGASGQSLNQIRETAESHLSAADGAIDRAIMGDAQARLEAIRQDGGQ
jgi:hypothetical protein